MKIISVVGARPNFMKIAPFIDAIKKHNTSTKNNSLKIQHLLVHTGQHYDDRMSKIFFEELGIDRADINLNIGSGSHAEQVGRTMIEFEKVIISEKPDWVVVVGDVNATLACSVTAKKMHIKVCHIEAGLRSGDERMPEEINRIVTDNISDLLLTPDKLSSENLIKEGIELKKINFVGNIMIDTLIANKPKAMKINNLDIINHNILDYHEHNYNNEDFTLLTMHRPSNVDDKNFLKNFLKFIINHFDKELKLIWPVHPRTLKRLKEYHLYEKLLTSKNIILLHPINYHEMLELNIDCKYILTDSGGLQEECTVLGTPCITLRSNTERPITLTKNGGVSMLVGNDLKKLKIEIANLDLNKKAKIPELWDGNTAERCLKSILEY